MQPTENPYASPNGGENASQTNRQMALRRLRPPAICLIIGGVLMLGLLGASIGANLLMYLLDSEEFVDSQLKIWAAYWYLFVLIILGNSFVIYAAVQMLRVRQFGACVFGAIIGLIPLITPCYFLGIPFAIWALIILLRQDTRTAFAEVK